MTPLEVIEREKTCVLRQGTADCDRDCKNCDLVLPADEVVKAYDYVTEHIRACERIIDSAHKCNDEYRLQTLELRQEKARLKRECEEARLRNRWHYTKDKDFPKGKGLYLVWRDFNGSQYPEMLAFDGRFWVTMSDSPSNRIVAWKEIEPPEGVWI